MNDAQHTGHRRFGVMPKQWKVCALGVVWVLGMLPATAQASHFRGGYITWFRSSGLTVEFSVRTFWLHGAINLNSCGTETEHQFNFGDGSGLAPSLCFTGGSANAVLIATQTDINGVQFDIIDYLTQHTYAGEGPFTAFLESCCRDDSLINNDPFDPAFQPYRVETVVDLGDGNSASPVTTMPPVIQFRWNTVNSLAIPVSDPEGDPLVCRLSTVGAFSESELFEQPTAGGQDLTVSAGCVLSWNTSGTFPGDRYAAQVMVAEMDGQTERSRIAIDFIIEIVDSGGPAPDCQAASSSHIAQVGVPFSQQFTATGVGNMTVNCLGTLPPGATLTPVCGTSSASPFAVTFDWTPQALDAGSAYAVTLEFTEDVTGLQSICSFTITVPSQQCQGRTYTTNADFNLGTLTNVFHSGTPGAPPGLAPDQLQLAEQTAPFPFICVACSNRGTIVRVATDNIDLDNNLGNGFEILEGEVIGEYFSAPTGRGRDPSRTTVDLLGNVWTGNRAEAGDNKGSCLKIGIVLGGTRGDKIGGSFVPNPNGEYLQPPFVYNTAVDRDGDGLIRTSRGLGNILDWPDVTDGLGGANGLVEDADDEAILIYQRLNDAVNTRHISVDSQNNVWVAGFPFATRFFYKLDTNTGAIIDVFDARNFGCGGYGGFIDTNNVLWSASSACVNNVLRYDLNTRTGCCIPMPQSYGMGIETDGGNSFVWCAQWALNQISKIDAQQVNCNAAVIAGFPKTTGGDSWDRGVAVTPADDNVWVANSHYTDGVTIFGGRNVSRLDENGNLLAVINTAGGADAQPTGVAVDANGKVWVPNLLTSTLVRINPATNLVDLTVDLNAVNPLGLDAHPYNYSDMTGIVGLQIAQFGSWTVKHSSLPGTEWTAIEWNQENCVTPHVPAGTTLTVSARAAETEIGLSSEAFVTVSNGVRVFGLVGAFIEVQVNFSGATSPAFATPVLCDLTINCNEIPVCDIGGPYVAACNSPTTNIQLDGSNSSDPELDPLSFLWDTDCPGGSFDDDTSETPVLSVAVPPGCTTCNVFLTVTDPGGSDSACTTTVELTNATPPTFTNVPPATSVVCDPDGNSDDLSNWLNAATATDDCGDVTIPRLLQSEPKIVGEVAKIKATWTATDECENTAEVSSTFTITDAEAPIVTCVPAQYAVPSDACELDLAPEGQPGFHLTPPAVTDNCGIDSVTHNAPDPLPIGNTLVTWVFTDAGGHSVTCVQTISVINTAPAIDQGPGPLSLNVDRNSTCPDASNEIALTATDPEQAATLQWSVKTPATKGNVSFIGGVQTGTAATVCYQPNSSVTGLDAFVIEVADDCGATDEIRIEVSIVIENCISPPSILSVRSVKTHGAAGDFGINMGIAPGSGDIECREGGITRIDVLFSTNILPSDGSLNVGDEVMVSSTPASGVNITNAVISNGNILRMDVAGSVNRSCVAVVIDGMACVPSGGGAPSTPFPTTTIRQRVLRGDVDNSTRVLNPDVNLAKAATGPTTLANFRRDITANGKVTSADINRIKGSVSILPVTCP